MSPPSAAAAASSDTSAHPPVGRAACWLPRLVALLALWHLGVVAVVMALRLGYPFELEWMEGGMLDHVLRLRHGLPLYGPPSLDFIPYVYPPLYHYVVWMAGLVVGHGFLVGRAISVVATLGSALLVAWMAARTSERRVQGLLAAGCLAGLYPVTGYWFDLVRVDTLLLVLVLGACAALARSRAWGVVVAALLLVAACFTKQNALLFLGAGGVFLLLRSWRQALLFAAVALPPLVAGSAWLWIESDGWVGYYLFEIPSSHGMHWYALNTLGDDLLWRIPGVALLVIPSAWLYMRARGSWLAWHKADPVPWFLGAAVVFSVSSRLHFGGAENVLIPMFAFFVVFVAGVPWRVARPWARVALPCLLGLQLGLWLWDPRDALPTQADREAGERFMQVLDGLGPRVLLPFHGHYLHQAGKQTCFHYQGLLDLTMPSRAYKARPEVEDGLLAQVENSFRRGTWDAVVLDTTDKGAVESSTMAHCEFGGPIFEDPEVFLQPSGMFSRPDTIWLPKEP